VRLTARLAQTVAPLIANTQKNSSVFGEPVIHPTPLENARWLQLEATRMLGLYSANPDSDSELEKEA